MREGVSEEVREGEREGGCKPLSKTSPRELTTHDSPLTHSPTQLARARACVCWCVCVCVCVCGVRVIFDVWL